MKKTSKKSDEVREIERLLPKVLDKILPSPETFAWGADNRFLMDGQKKEVRFIPYNKPSLPQDMVNHFLQKPVSDSVQIEEGQSKQTERGQVYVQLSDEDCRVKSFFAGASTLQDKEEIRTKLLPRLDDYGIEPIINYADSGLLVWFFCDTSVPVLRTFINQIIDDTEMRVSEELYLVPTHKQVLVPIPGGCDLNTNRVYPVEFRGNLQRDALYVMKAIIECSPMPEEVMKMLCTSSTKAN